MLHTIAIEEAADESPEGTMELVWTPFRSASAATLAGEFIGVFARFLAVKIKIGKEMKEKRDEKMK